MLATFLIFRKSGDFGTLGTQDWDLEGILKDLGCGKSVKEHDVDGAINATNCYFPN